MSVALPALVPEALARALAREPSGDDDLTVLVLSQSDGWPHLAMVSVGELAVAGPRSLMLALWPSSTATAALTAEGRATLAAVVDGTSYALRVTVRRGDDLVTPLGGTLACFAARVAAATSDVAPYAVLESGVRFRLTDPDTALPRWRQVREALRLRAEEEGER